MNKLINYKTVKYNFLCSFSIINDNDNIFPDESTKAKIFFTFGCDWASVNQIQ